jgi:hypothetical protein
MADLLEARAYDYAAKLADQQAVFQGKMRELAAEMRSGAITVDQWYYRSQVVVQDHVLDGYRLGLAKSRGVAPNQVRLTADERKAANAQIIAQYGYLAKFRDAVKARIAVGKALTMFVIARAALYGGGMRDAFGAASLGDAPEERLTWVRHATDSCDTCLMNDGQTKTAAEWQAGGVWPAHGTDCRSNCLCSLDAAEE